MEPEQRCRWFREALSRTWRAAPADPRQPVWLVVEPAVAALWAYGVARLLPEGPLRNEVGFSTFETDPERAKSPLVATWFHDPQAVAAQPRGRAAPGVGGQHARKSRTPEKPRPVRKYAAAILRELIERGCEAVDRDLAALASAHVARPPQLESLAAAGRNRLGLAGDRDARGRPMAVLAPGDPVRPAPPGPAVGGHGGLGRGPEDRRRAGRPI